MQMFKSYQSPLGYTNGKNNIDSYGVDHSQFSTQDELAYQFARRNRENQLIQNYNAQGISNNYPQSGTDFWGNPENNYGFGTSNIKNSAEKIEQTPIPQYWTTADEGKKVFNYVQQREGNVIPEEQNIINYTQSMTKGGISLCKNFFPMRKLPITDKYKHAFMNCNAAQYGQGGADIAELFSNLKEWKDQKTGTNTLDSSEADNYANQIGRLLGTKYPDGDCNELIKRYIKKNL